MNFELKQNFLHLEKKPSNDMVYSWYDINWDGKQNLLYWYWWKLFLHDLESGLNLWETKVLWIYKIISVESLLWDNMEKQILVAFGWESYYMWVLDWKTWELINSSQSFFYEMNNTSLTNNSATNEVIRRESNWDVHIIFQNIYAKDFSLTLTLSWWTTPMLKPFYTDHWLHNWETWWPTNDSYQTIWKINNDYYTVSNNDSRIKILNISWANESTKYIPTQEINISRYENTPWVYSSAWATFLYDFNNDWNDEFISWSPNKRYNSSRWFHDWFVIVWWKKTESEVWFYWGYTTKNDTPEGYVNWIRTVRVAKNYSNLNESHLFVQNNDDWGKRYAFGIKWSSWSVFPTSFPTWSNQNIKLDYIYDRSMWDISWMFNNGSKDLVMTNKDWKYNFYSYSWSWTFSTWSTAIIDWSYYGIACNKDTKSYFTMPWYHCWIDSDWNWYTEFITYKDWYFIFNEIREVYWELKVFEIKKIKYSWNETWTIMKRWLTSDYSNIWTVSYSSTDNKLNVFYWDSEEALEGGFYNMKKVNSWNIYWWWNTYNPKIFNIKNKNYVLINSKLYDFSEASPIIEPNIVSTSFNQWWYVLDKDPSFDNWNEFIYNNNTYKINDDFSLSNIQSNWCIWDDFNDDWVMDCIQKRRDPSSSLHYPWQYRIISWKDNSELLPWTTIWWCSQYGNVDIKILDYNNDGKKDIVLWSTWCFWWGVYSWVDLSKLADFSWERNLAILDIEPGKKSIIWRVWNFRNYYIKRDDFDLNWNHTNEFTTWYIPDPVFLWDWDVSTISLNKDDENNLNMLFKVYNWRVLWINTDDWSIKFDNLYYWWKSYSTLSWTTLNIDTINKAYYNVFNDWWVPIHIVNALVWDFTWDWKNNWLLWSRDWLVYIIDIDNWDVIKTYDIWNSIQSLVTWDVNNDWILDILVSSEDWYIYQLTNSNLSEPSWVKDWLNYWFDIQTQTDNKKVWVNFAKVNKATWYFVQLYNATEKSQVFDWIDVWNNLKACIRSVDIVDENCISAWKTFNLNGKSKYEWRVQAYNTNVTSPNANSDWFTVLRLEIDKKVALKENMTFEDELTVSPNTLLTYSITLFNDSLNTIGWAWFMNYDMIPAQPVASCDGIYDCRTKNITITDYMPSTFTYMSNSTVWIIKKVSYDWSEEILAWWSQVSDGYFKNQSDTVLTTLPWETLIWQFPANVAIPPWAILELQFDAIARQ